MTRILSEGFEMGDISALSGNSGGSMRSSGTPRSGQYHIYFGFNANGFISFPEKNELYVRSCFKLDGAQRAYAEALRLRNGGTTYSRLYVEGTSSILYAQVGNNAAVNISTPNGIGLSPGIYYLAEVYLKIDDTVGRYIVKLNGKILYDFTGNTKTSTPTTVDNIFFQSEFDSYRTYIYIDDLAINDTEGEEDNSWPGDGHIIRMGPNANGDASMLKGNDDNYVDNYLLVDDRPHDGDTSYVIGENIEDKDLYNFVACGLPADQIIKRVWVEATAKDPSGGDVALLMKSGSTEDEDDPKTLGSAYDIIKSSEYLTNPDTGEPWTESELDAVQAGMKVKS